jgi:hypothetical protein
MIDFTLRRGYCEPGVSSVSSSRLYRNQWLPDALILLFHIALVISLADTGETLRVSALWIRNKGEYPAIHSAAGVIHLGADLLSEHCD